MVKRTGFLLSALLCGSGLAVWAAAGPFPAADGVNTITRAHLKSDLYFLASDEMQGRDVGTLSNRVAARYIAHRFELMGLEPVGDDYFQYFTLLQSTLGHPNRLEVWFHDSPLASRAILKQDFYPSPYSASGHVRAAVVFAGYGITAPRYGYDDYGGVDVSGRLVLVMNHEPGERDAGSPFDGRQLSEYGTELAKIFNAQGQGAAGILLVPDVVNHRASELRRRARFVWPKDRARGRYLLESWSRRIQIPVVHVSPELAGKLLGERKLEELEKQIDEASRPHSSLLAGVEVELDTTLAHTRLRLPNVVARLTGSDPALREEVVIVSAHLDHVGVRGGEVYNGADDDGSGTVGVLEVAEAAVHSSRPPRRTLLFAAWNAEERGELGSRYYVEHPLVPLKRTAAVFQMDMIGRNEEVHDPENFRFRGLPRQSAAENANSVNVLGYTRVPDLKALVVRENRAVGLDLKFRYDNHQINLLRRSDNWPFLVAGVPALFFHTGLHPDYHRPTDTPEKINYPKMERIVRLVYLSAWAAANSAERPRLVPAGP